MADPRSDARHRAEADEALPTRASTRPPFVAPRVSDLGKLTTVTLVSGGGSI
jgi:hypothetical protein